MRTDTDPDNGGLCLLPGSHRGGLRSVHKASDTKEHITWVAEHTMRDRDGREWPQTLVAFEIDDIDPDSLLRLTVPCGSGVFFTGMTIHGSFSNRSFDRTRIAFATHYIHEDSWLFRTDVQETMPAVAAA